MDELMPAERDGNKPVKIPAIKFSRDAGTSWARALTTTQIADLVDLAGELSVVFSVAKQKRTTETQFNGKLRSLGQFAGGNGKLLRIVGNTGGVVTLYHVWWSWAWVYNFQRVHKEGDRSDDEVREETARRMGITGLKAGQMLARRDISYMVNLFLARVAREMRGEVMFMIAKEASTGVSRAADIYFKHVDRGDEGGERAGGIDPFNLTEGELQAEILKMRKSLDTKKDDWQIPAPPEEDG